MDHSSGQHHETQAQPLENMLAISCPKVQQENRKPMRPQPEQALRCPRCDSTNTKFCYYNNYSLSQPRYFCKSCRRYWTKGGTLRNVPVGGGCRKNKRPSPSTSSSSSPSSKRSHDQPLSANSSRLMLTDTHLPSLAFEPTDLSLAFAKLQNQSNGQMGPFDTHNNFQNMYCGFGSGSSGEVENGGFPTFEHYNSSGIASTATATAMKQELACNGDQNTVLWGFPWQFNYGDGNYMGDLDSGRESWNFNGNGIASSWHGLLNSPLINLWRTATQPLESAGVEEQITDSSNFRVRLRLGLFRLNQERICRVNPALYYR